MKIFYKILMAILLSQYYAPAAFSESNEQEIARGLRKYPAEEIYQIAKNCALAHSSDVGGLEIEPTTVELDPVGYQGIYDYWYSSKFHILNSLGVRTGAYVEIFSLNLSDIDIYPVQHHFSLRLVRINNGLVCI